MPTETESATLQHSSLAEVERMVVSAGIPPSSFMPRLAADLQRSSDPQRSLTGLHRYLQSAFSTSVLRDFDAHPALQGIFLDLVGQSQYLTDILVRSPELLHWLTSTGELTSPKNARTFETESRTALEPFGRWEKKVDALKRFQRREILRIAARDILGRADLTSTTSELSTLADVIVERVLGIGTGELRRRSGSDTPEEFAVIGLGKLGGRELNYSSDIDLLFVYERDGEFESATERLKTLHELFVRLAEFIVQALTGHTGEGHLFRVDLRLRPDGSSGPLAMSREAYRMYYESRGELWERQMLLKARVVAGNKATGERFLDDLEPFVFPKAPLRNPLDAIAEIKKRIEEGQEDDRNIKLGVGGIRDIEFIIQALQLLYAGSDASLRDSNSLEALSSLKEKGLLSRKEYDILTSAYVFLRNVEHRLQLMHGMQTHVLPSTEDESAVLARRMAFGSADGFAEAIGRHRQEVRKVYDSVFRTQMATGGVRPGLRHKRIRGYRKKAATKSQVQQTFSETTVQSFLRTLADESSPREVRELTEVLQRDGAPEKGLSHLSWIAASDSGRRLLSLGLGSPICMKILVRVASRSESLSRMLANEPLLLETVLGHPGEAFGKSTGWKFLRSVDLNRFKQYNEFRIAARFLLGKADLRTTTTALSDLAEDVLTCEWDRRLLEAANELGGTGLSVVALGKFGGREITIGSDLDLVFVYRSSGRTDSRPAVERFFRELVRSFSGTGPRTYSIDVRLRPEGKNAPLAVDLEYLKDYLQERALLWERQSFLKARIICGDRRLARDVGHAIRESVYHAPRERGWGKEVIEMRKRIEVERSPENSRGIDLKTGKGGLLDIEFAVQALQLRYGRTNARLRRANTFDALEGIAGVRGFGRRDGATLRSNYVFLRTVETFIRLNRESSRLDFLPDTDFAPAVAAALGSRSTRHLYAQLRTILSQNRSLLKKTLTFCGR